MESDFHGNLKQNIDLINKSNQKNQESSLNCDLFDSHDAHDLKITGELLKKSGQS